MSAQAQFNAYSQTPSLHYNHAEDALEIQQNEGTTDFIDNKAYTI